MGGEDKKEKYRGGRNRREERGRDESVGLVKRKQRQRKLAEEKQEELHNSWGPVQNENVGTLVKKLIILKW